MKSYLYAGAWLLLGLVLPFTMAYWFAQPLLCLTVGEDVLLRVPAEASTPLKIRFIHSVQKTPVEEQLRVDESLTGFTLNSTRYQSFGVGLPFLASEGDFHVEGDYFVMDNMERHFPTLSLRTGLGTELTVTIGQREFRLYEMYPPGTLINLVIKRRWETIFW